MIRIREGNHDEVVQLLQEIPEFKNPYEIEEIEKRLSGEYLILICESEDEKIGFKCGYRKSDNTFYSWLGGVKKEYRKQGIADLLLAQMEDWCRGKDYDFLEFKTLNEHVSMLIFSLKRGFQITEVLDSVKDKRKRILLVKTLRDGRI